MVSNLRVPDFYQAKRDMIQVCRENFLFAPWQDGQIVGGQVGQVGLWAFPGKKKTTKNFGNFVCLSLSYPLLLLTNVQLVSP